VRGVQKEYAGKIDVVRVNILDEQNGPLLAQFGFNTTPEFYLLDRSGEIVAFWDGPVEPDELRAAFDRVLE
jgi:thioredoxin-like negative regulator of GroEL